MPGAKKSSDCVLCGVQNTPVIKQAENRDFVIGAEMKITNRQMEVI